MMTRHKWWYDRYLSYFSCKKGWAIYVGDQRFNILAKYVHFFKNLANLSSYNYLAVQFYFWYKQKRASKAVPISLCGLVLYTFCINISNPTSLILQISIFVKYETQEMSKKRLQIFVRGPVRICEGRRGFFAHKGEKGKRDLRRKKEDNTYELNRRSHNFESPRG